MRKAVSGDPDRAIEIGRPKSSTGGLTAAGGAALAHGGEVARAGVGVGYSSSEVPGVGQDQQGEPHEHTGGFWPRNRGQRWENGGGRAPGGLGVTLARNPGRRERQSSVIGLGLVPVGVGDCYGPTSGHGAGLSWPDTTRGAASRRDQTPMRPNWLRSGVNKENQAREWMSDLGMELEVT
jgi:hypothetical protein